MIWVKLGLKVLILFWDGKSLIVLLNWLIVIWILFLFCVWLVILEILLIKSVCVNLSWSLGVFFKIWFLVEDVYWLVFEYFCLMSFWLVIYSIKLIEYWLVDEIWLWLLSVFFKILYFVLDCGFVVVLIKVSISLGFIEKDDCCIVEFVIIFLSVGIVSLGLVVYIILV